MTEKVARLKFDFRWPQPDLSLLLQELKNDVLPFLGDQQTVWGTVIEVGDIEIEHRIESLDELNSFIGHALRKVTVNLKELNGDRSFYISVEPASKTVWGDVESNVANVSDIQQLITNFSTTLGLETVPQKTTTRQKLIRAKREYDYEKPQTPEKFLEIVEWLLAKLPQPPEHFDSAVILQGYEIPATDPKEWQGIVVSKWQEAKEIRCWFDAPNHSVYVRENWNDERLTIEIHKNTPVEAEALFDELEKAFQLERTMDELRQEKIGTRRKYYVQAEMTKEWINKALDTILLKFKNKKYFSGRYQLISAPTQEVTRENLQTWQAEVNTQWEKILSGSLWFDERTFLIDLKFDPLREIVDLRVDAFNQEKVDELFAFLETNLNLVVVQEEPYQFRKSSGAYEIQGWRNVRFAEAVETAVQLFVGEKFALVDGYVELGPEKNGELEGFTSFDEFLERIRSDELYADAELYIQGPRGVDLFVSALDNHQKLRLASTIKPKEFSQLEDIFEKKLKLKEISSVGEENGQTKSKEQPFFKDVIKIVLPLIIGFLLSSLFWANIFPKSSLEITIPQPANGESVLIQSSSIPVEWVLETEQWFQRKIDRTSIARVRVLANGLIPIQDLVGRSSEVILELEPGIYDIEVINESSNVSDKVRIEIQEPQEP